jgi:hypothetical protein
MLRNKAERNAVVVFLVVLAGVRIAMHMASWWIPELAMHLQSSLLFRVSALTVNWVLALAAAGFEYLLVLRCRQLAPADRPPQAEVDSPERDVDHEQQ